MNSEKYIENDDIEIDLLAFALKLKANWKKICIGFLLGALVGAIYSTFFVTPMYQSTAMVYLRGSGNTISLQDLQLGTQLTKDYEIIFKSRPIMEKTIEELNLDMTPTTLANSISVSNPEDSRILEITTTAESPDLAKSIVNSIMDNGIETVREIDAQDPYIIEKGVASTAKVGMSRTKMTFLAAILGMICMTGVLFIHFVLSDNVKSADDIEKTLGVPVLSVIAEESDVKASRKKKK